MVFHNRFQVYRMKYTEMILYSVLSSAAALFESLGIFFVLPVFEFIKVNKDLSQVSSSIYWKSVIYISELLHLPITLVFLMIISGFMFIAKQLFIYIAEVYNYYLFERSRGNLKTTLFNEYLKAPFRVSVKIDVGTIVNTLSTEETRNLGWLKTLVGIIQNLVMLISYFAVLLLTSYSLTFISLGLFFLSSIAVYFQMKQSVAISSIVTEQNKLWSSKFIEKLYLLRLIKLTANEKLEQDNNKKCALEACNQQFKLSSISALVKLIIEPFNILNVFIIIFVAVEFLSMDIMVVGAFLLILIKIANSVKALSYSWQQFSGLTGAVVNYLKLLKNIKKGGDLTNKIHVKKIPFPSLQKGIKLEKITFSHEDADVIKQVSCFVPRNQITALLGDSGAGKSTLIDLITRLYIPKSGKILFDNVDYLNFADIDFYKNFAVVSQEPKLFNGSIKENISYGLEIDEKDVITAAKSAYCHDFICQLEGGYDFEIGTKGRTLSGGEKQRISLARALIRKPSILILDEPTSALDSESEKFIKLAIAKLRKENNTTIIIIAHSLSTINIVDNIIVIKDGELLEQGTYADLKDNSDWYQKQFELQKI